MFLFTFAKLENNSIRTKYFRKKFVIITNFIMKDNYSTNVFSSTNYSNLFKMKISKRPNAGTDLVSVRTVETVLLDGGYSYSLIML